jgi:hypothetical protein
MAKKPKIKKYKHVDLNKIVGKTVERVAGENVEGAFGDEPCTMLYFTDGTKHGFVHPSDDDDEDDEAQEGVAEEFLEHKGVIIYHAYKEREDPVQGVPQEWWYSTSICAGMSEFEFDVRDLPGYRELYDKLHHTVLDESIIKKAIDAGLLKQDVEPDTEAIKAAKKK